MPQTYSLHVHSVSGIKWRKKWPIAPNLEVTIDVDDIRMAETHRKRDFVPMWNSLLPLSAARPTSVIGLHLVRHHTVGKTNICAKGEIEIYVPIPLKSVGKDLEPTPGLALVVRLARIGSDEAVKIAVTDAAEDSEKLGSGTSSDIHKVADFAVQNSDSNTVSSLGDLLQSLTSSLDVVIKIGGVIAKIHPFAELAYNVLTSVYQAVKKQRKMDQAIIQLVQAMVDVYSFTKDVKLLSEIECIKDIVDAIVQETAKCALFIREYTGHGFAVRMVSQIVSEDAQTIQELMGAFVKHKQSLDWALGIHVAVVVDDTRHIAQLSLKVAKDTQATAQRLEQLEILKNLNPVKMNSNRDGCLLGTRRDILRVIITELTKPFAPDSQNIFWLYGVAGAGKSAIATSIRQTFNTLGLLGASLFFTRSNEASNPASVIPTLAYCLAESNTHIGSEICLAMRQHLHIVDAPIEDQFQRLLGEPLDRAKDHIHGPIIIILDALDECGDPESRRRLISLISNRFTGLPLLRILITSRPNLDIAAAFRGQSSIIKTPLDITKPSSLEDVRRYIDAEMIDVQQMHFSWNLGPTWPGKEKIDVLSTFAAGLFIWASTATKYLRKAHDPNDALDHLLRKGSDLDCLYAVALQSTEFWEDKTFAERAQACLAAVVLGKVPMSDTTINALLGLDTKHSSAPVFFKLGCVLQWAPGKFARILHTSFGDYLTDPDRCGQEPWFIDPAFWGPQLARSCLQVLNTELQFNICRLEDSHISNSAVHDLSDRIATYIPPHLSYSSCFWADHILGAEWDEVILADIENLMYNKFPFWLEILSILGKIGIAINALRHVGEVAKQRNIALAEFLADAIKFMVAFAPAFTHSVPHLYISALPLAPSESHVAEKFLKWLIQKVGLHSSLGLGNHWPALQMTIKAHNEAILTVAFSPGDGERIASGSDDTTVCVWDARTGILIAAPFEGHTKRVSCVAFSPDGERIVSGSIDATVRIMDSRTGVLVAGPIQHSDEVSCVAFSPDGEQIVSGCHDNNIYIWNSRTGAQITVLEGHSNLVWSVAFSQDGDRIVSGSVDNTLRLWDARTKVGIASSMEGYTAKVLSGGTRNPMLLPSDGEILAVDDGGMVDVPLEGHSNKVTSVAFSCDGKRIVSGSCDKTVCVWDVQTGALLIRPIQHDDLVWSVAFSPDGEQIVSGGRDTKVRVWNSQTGTLVAGPFQGHSNAVNSVAFSPPMGNGFCLVLQTVQSAFGMYRHLGWSKSNLKGTAMQSDCFWIQGWNVTGPIQTNPVYCIAFSPNGVHIASGSTDSTISVWNAQTGDLVTQLEGHTNVIHSVAFSPGDGERIASGSSDTTVRVWNAKTGVLVAGPFEGHSQPADCVAFSPDGERIASGSYDTTVHVWNSKTGAVVAGPFHHDKEVNCVAFSPDGTRIMVCFDTTVRIFNAQSGTILLDLPEWHSDTIHYVAFSPDGEQIVSGSDDNTVRMWPMQTSFQGHSAAITSVAFSSNGNSVISSSLDRTIRVLEV
ncbi:WD40 repeat-like protein [Mycena venus]|uniref:WD40 repeat-like protein n=1 Tax=Mycena venus TaxID=2733690 RepID=A0A8H7D876_9AGAR|nr:WD40 repeat-like protein [Mycena venus]